MNEAMFLATMMDVLKYDSKFKNKKDTLLPILRRSYVNSLPQYEYVRYGRSGQRYENVEIRVPVPMLDVANAVHDDIYKLVEYVYEESDDYGLGGVPIRPKILRADEVEYKEHDVVFSEIQEVVIQGIRDAKYTIWAAVAWLSNQAIIDELMAKKRQGVHVRMIISEEDTNRPYYRQLSENFDLRLIPHHGWNDWNRMHDKFCIIDFEYVMHGSYNWTKTANFNDETLATALDRDFVKKFADEFIRLYGEGHPVQQ